nr:laccase-12-like [Ipomoea batatas]GMC80147.1 laccase-12-like [Ipomoea batatas]
MVSGRLEQHGQMDQSSLHSAQLDQETVILTDLQLTVRKEHFGGMPTAHGLGQLSMELLSSTQGQGNPIHSLSLQEKRPLYMVIVIRQAQKTGAAPNVSNAFTINGQPGDLYQCSSQVLLYFDTGTLTYWLRCRPEAVGGRRHGQTALQRRSATQLCSGYRQEKRAEELQEPFECLSAGLLDEGFPKAGVDEGVPNAGVEEGVAKAEEDG